jgi:hypothetical protein
MKLSREAQCWKCGVKMEPGEFYQLSATPEGVWKPHHAESCPEPPAPRQAPAIVSAGQASNQSAWLHVEGAFTMPTFTGRVELVWPWPSTNTEDLRGFIRARLKDIKEGTA